MNRSEGAHPNIELFPLNMGEEADLERLFLLYHAPLCYFCEHLTGDDQASEDLISQLFLNLWQKKVVFQSPEHAKAYLYRSAKNICLNYLRNEQRAKEKGQASLLDEPASNQDYLQVFIRTEVWAELYRAIESLPPQCSKVINMSYLDGMSNQEIADELDLSIQTVKNYKLRGLAILKDRLPDSMLIFIAMYFVK